MEGGRTAFLFPNLSSTAVYEPKFPDSWIPETIILSVWAEIVYEVICNIQICGGHQGQYQRTDLVTRLLSQKWKENSNLEICGSKFLKHNICAEHRLNWIKIMVNSFLLGGNSY